MNLPRTKFADTNGHWRQFWHLCSEVWEVFIGLILAAMMPKQLKRKSYACVGDELVDVQISAQTLRWIIADKYGVSMADCEDYVFRKGVERGYYHPPPKRMEVSRQDVREGNYPKGARIFVEY